MTMLYKRLVCYSAIDFKNNVYSTTFHAIVLLEPLPDYAKIALFPTV